MNWPKNPNMIETKLVKYENKFPFYLNIAK